MRLRRYLDSNATKHVWAFNYFCNINIVLHGISTTVFGFHFCALSFAFKQKVNSRTWFLCFWYCRHHASFDVNIGKHNLPFEKVIAKCEISKFGSHQMIVSIFNDFCVFSFVCDLDNNLFLNLYGFSILLKQRKNEIRQKTKKKKIVLSSKITNFGNQKPYQKSDLV